ncbi:hypothetical protein ES703_12504 [subsurface metagenome]
MFPGVMLVNYWVLGVGLVGLCMWVLLCYLAVREEVEVYEIAGRTARDKAVLRDMVEAYNRDDWRQLTLILGSSRFSNGGRGPGGD